MKKPSSLGVVNVIRAMLESCNGEPLPKPIYKFFKQIEKDLKILNILKFYLRTNELVDCVGDLDGSIYLDLMLKRDSNKIRKWLKNDNNN